MISEDNFKAFESFLGNNTGVKFASAELSRVGPKRADRLGCCDLAWGDLRRWCDGLFGLGPNDRCVKRPQACFSPGAADLVTFALTRSASYVLETAHPPHNLTSDDATELKANSDWPDRDHQIATGILSTCSEDIIKSHIHLIDAVFPRSFKI